MYWGYIGKDGKHHIKRFGAIYEIHDAYSSGECVKGMGPFIANTPKEAMAIVKRLKP